MDCYKYGCKLIHFFLFIVCCLLCCECYAFTGEGFVLDEKGWERKAEYSNGIDFFAYDFKELIGEERRTKSIPYFYVRHISSVNEIPAEKDNLDKFREWYEGFAYNGVLLKRKDFLKEELKMANPGLSDNELYKLVVNKINSESKLNYPEICEISGTKAFKIDYDMAGFYGINYTIPWDDDFYMITFNYENLIDLPAKENYKRIVDSFKITAEQSTIKKITKVIDRPLVKIIILIFVTIIIFTVKKIANS